MKFTTPWPKVTNYNVSSTNHLQTFIQFVGGFLFLMLVLYGLLYMISNILAQYISLDKEHELFWDAFHDEFIIHTWQTEYVQTIANKLLIKTEKNTQKLKWKDDWKHTIFIPKIYVVSENTSEDSWEIDKESSLWENAFASLWTSIYITRELFENVASLEELQFIIWHEYSHVYNQDALKWLIRDVPFVIIASIFWEQSSSFSSLWTVLFSKNIEKRADTDWIQLVFASSTTSECALAFFGRENTLRENVRSSLSDHPMTNDRLNNITKILEENGHDVPTNTGNCTPLPTSYY